MIKQGVYRVIYQPQINYLLRNINRFMLPVLPSGIKLPPSGTLTIRTREGGSLKLRTNQTCYATKLIFWDGGYLNYEYSAIYVRLIKKVNSFFDIGSNLGYYSLLAEHLNPAIRVTAFEPAEGPLHYLRENIRLNKCSNIAIESIALSDREGEIEFHEIQNEKYSYLRYNLAGENNTGTRELTRPVEKHKVKTKTLDAYVREKGISSIDLMKIDTEGSEHLILSKAHHVLTTMKPIIIVETLPGLIEAQLEDAVSPFGYQFYNHVGTGLKKADTLRRSVDDGVRDCFLVHPEKRHLIEEFLLDN